MGEDETELNREQQGRRAVRLSQARHLWDSVPSSCWIVLGVIGYVAVLLVANDDYQMAFVWSMITAGLVCFTYGYSRILYTGGITEDNFQKYLKGHIGVSAITGFTWGFLAIVQMRVESGLSLYIAVQIVCSITLGGMFPNSAHRPSYIALLTFCVTPLVIYWFVIMPSPLRYLSIGLGLYFIFGLMASARSESNMADVILARQDRQVAESADLANKEKSRFLIAAIHDFSQPLHAQGYFINALRARLSDEEALGLLDSIETSWWNLDDLIKGLGDIAKLDSGMIQPEMMVVNVQQLLERVADEFKSEISKKKLTFNIDVAPRAIVSDPRLLARIVQNLFSNAIKYTPTGGEISLRSEVREDHLTIEIEDNGVGIAEEDQSRVFDEYVRLDNKLPEHVGGLGIGLSIVKRLCKLLDIELQLESTEGQGARFTLVTELGREPGNDTLIPGHEPLIESALFIVVVDDEAEIRSAMTQLLSDWGCEVISAASPSQARDMLAESQLPDLLLVDYRLRAEQNGLELINALRDDFNEDIPAVLMTGDIDALRGVTFPRDVKMRTKPIDSKALRELISQLRAGKGGVQP